MKFKVAGNCSRREPDVEQSRADTGYERPEEAPERAAPPATDQQDNSCDRESSGQEIETLEKIDHASEAHADAEWNGAGLAVRFEDVVRPYFNEELHVHCGGHQACTDVISRSGSGLIVGNTPEGWVAGARLDDAHVRAQIIGPSVSVVRVRRLYNPIPKGPYPVNRPREPSGTCSLAERAPIRLRSEVPMQWRSIS